MINKQIPSDAKSLLEMLEYQNIIVIMEYTRKKYC
jgi:uncharacterized protein (UPF0216 family)